MMFDRPDTLNIISIDPSVRATGVCTCRQGKITTEVIKRKEDRIPLLAYYLRYFATMAKNTKWDLLIIEGYSFGSQSQSVTRLAEIGGIIRECFASYNVPILEISPATWKSISGVNDWQKTHDVKLKKLTKADQAQYQEACFDLIGISCSSCDEVDALLMFYTAIQCSKGLAKKGAGSTVRQFLEDHHIVLENKQK
jgi:Holliday junction resolvasome RuvABC endonuclease subunit